MLPPGLYEQVINTALNRELSEIPDARKSVAPIDKAEASKVLAQYLADVVQKGLENVVDNGGDISTQIGLANQIVGLIQNITQEADFAALNVDQRAEQLLALLREQDPRLAVGKTAADLIRPETSIAQSSLFTGAIHEPQMYSELKKEIVSADRIDMLVSFIKWSGLRLLMDELREFTQNGGELRIITTSYMGATDVKAIEELRKLPNTKIKVSYDTKRTRLHAKTYVFYRNTGFTTAYVGSSNLSNAAISSGLEWNIKVTRRDLPETIDKIAATFESYWNSSEFEYYSEDQKERLARALKAEKYFDANNAEVYTMDIAPYSYQQEILDKLEAERTVRGARGPSPSRAGPQPSKSSAEMSTARPAAIAALRACGVISLCAFSRIWASSFAMTSGFCSRYSRTLSRPWMRVSPTVNQAPPLSMSSSFTARSMISPTFEMPWP